MSQNQKPSHRLFNTNKELNPILIIISVMALMFVIYISCIAIWDATSVNYKPTNWLDSEVKTPLNPMDWFVRNKDGIY